MNKTVLFLMSAATAVIFQFWYSMVWLNTFIPTNGDMSVEVLKKVINPDFFESMSAFSFNFFMAASVCYPIIIFWSLVLMFKQINDIMNPSKIRGPKWK